jgi:hypothetical protein
MMTLDEAWAGKAAAGARAAQIAEEIKRPRPPVVVAIVGIIGEAEPSPLPRKRKAPARQR